MIAFRIIFNFDFFMNFNCWQNKNMLLTHTITVSLLMSDSFQWFNSLRAFSLIVFMKLHSNLICFAFFMTVFHEFWSHFPQQIKQKSTITSMIVKHIALDKIHRNWTKYRTVNLNILLHYMRLIFEDLKKTFQIYLLINIILIKSLI